MPSRNENRFVDHEMIAAGHPDLFFELDSFSAVMPRHWKSPRESEPGKKAVEDAAWVGVPRMERGPSRTTACGDGAIDLARTEMNASTKRRLAGVFRAFLFCLPSRSGPRERQLAPGACLHRPPSRRSGME